LERFSISYFGRWGRGAADHSLCQDMQEGAFSDACHALCDNGKIIDHIMKIMNRRKIINFESDWR
jgi:hypothetical protein